MESQALVEAEINILQLQPMPALWQEFDGAVNRSCEALKNSEPKVRATAEKAGKDWEKVELRLQKQKDFLSQLLT